MGKNKNNKSNVSGKQADKAGKHSSAKKLKRDAKSKKAKPDHLSDIPFRLREIMKSKERMKTGSLRAKKPKQAISHESKPGEDGDIPVLHFKRGKQESEKAYVRRMETETKHIHFLTKNQVDRQPELDDDSQDKSTDKGKSEKKKEHDKGRLQRLQLKKLDRQEDKMEKEMFIDNVPFGEVAMAPPSFSSKPRKAPVKSQNASKKLLLNSLLGHTVSSTAKPSMARQRIMEEERVRAVEAYRHLKKQRQQQHEAKTAGLEKLKNPQ